MSQDSVPGPARTTDQLSHGEDLDLEPLEALDLSTIGSFSGLLEAMKKTSFGGRQLGEAADVLCEMIEDPDCFVVGTFSGAMTVAKQGLVLCDMLDHGMLDAVVSTGALMAHGFVEAAGMTHFKWRGDQDDRELYYRGFDRIYDTLELERNLDDVEIIVRQVLEDWDPSETVASHSLNRALGLWLSENTKGRGILKSAYHHKIPVYVPAFTDSELGLDFAIGNRVRKRSDREPLHFDPFLDLEHYAEQILGTKRLGIFTIGGGVPRNWAQQIGPYLDILDKRGAGDGGLYRFRYAVRICPEPVHWGGLSGCTYSEGISWGKFLPPSEGGRFAEVPADATLVWPLLIKAVLERRMAKSSKT